MKNSILHLGTLRSASALILMMCAQAATTFAATSPQTKIRFLEAPTLATGTPSWAGPYVVHVDALTSTLGTGASPITTRYEWNFGDTRGNYSQLRGFNAAHFYEYPGTYTITLKITQANGAISTVSRQLTISNDTRRTVYVDSASGNDANDGSSPTKAIRSLARLNSLGALSNARVLLNRSQVFTVPSSGIRLGSNVLIRPYGTSTLPKPIIQASAADTGMILTSESTSNNVILKDVDLRSDFTETNPAGVTKWAASGFKAQGANIALINAQLKGLHTGILGYAVRGLLVQGTYSTGITDISGHYFYTTTSTGVVALGNSVPNSTLESIFRFHLSDQLNLFKNRLANLDRSIHSGGTDNDDLAKCAIRLASGNWMYVGQNTLGEWVNGQPPTQPSGLLTIGHMSGVANIPELLKNLNIEDNTFTNTNILHGTEGLMLRNNVIRLNATGIFSRILVGFRGWTEQAQVSGGTVNGEYMPAGTYPVRRGLKDISIIGNTLENFGAQGRAFFSFAQKSWEDGTPAVTLKDNRIVRAPDAGVRMDSETPNQVFRFVQGNQWPEGALFFGGTTRHDFNWWNSQAPVAGRDNIAFSASTRIAFGGMYGFGGVNSYPNPANNFTFSCPAGFADVKVLGTAYVDYDLHYCYRLGGEDAMDFGGMYGYVNNGQPAVNPATGSMSCPAGYTAYAVLGTTNMDWPIFLCGRNHQDSINGLYQFGGMFGEEWNYSINSYNQFTNPLAGNASACPAGFTSHKVLGTTNQDFPVSFCKK